MGSRKKIILTCKVLPDGTGDFTYLTSICNYLSLLPGMKDYDIIAVVTCSFPELINGFERRLQELNISRYYLGTYENFKPIFLHNESFRQDLSEAEQIIMISSNNSILYHDPDFLPLINKNVKLNYIGEHEWTEEASGTPGFALGLTDAAYGLKLEAISKITSERAFRVFQEHDSKFSQALLNYTNSRNADDLFSCSTLIPAYYNKRLAFFKFIAFTAVNAEFQPKGNIIFNLSGLDPGLFPDYCSIFPSFPGFSKSKIKQIIYINADSNEPQIYNNNPDGSTNMYILHNFKISDTSFRAMYQQAILVGASGDNTFELAISSGTLPYYHSTNASSKKKTLDALVRIIQDKIPNIPENTKNDFIIYLGNLYNWNEFSTRYATAPSNLKLIDMYSKLNVVRMIQYWPVIADYLKEHYNYYDKIEAVIKNNPVENNGHYFNRIPSVISQAPAATLFPQQSVIDETKSDTVADKMDIEPKKK